MSADTFRSQSEKTAVKKTLQAFAQTRVGGLRFVPVIVLEPR